MTWTTELVIGFADGQWETHFIDTDVCPTSLSELELLKKFLEKYPSYENMPIAFVNLYHYNENEVDE